MLRRMTKKRRERDIANFMFWLDRKGIYLGQYSNPHTPVLMRLETHSFSAERELVAEYVERFEAPR